MIIDIHNHPDWHGHDLASFLSNMDSFGIEKTWLLSWEAPRDEFDPGTVKFFCMSENGFPIPFSRCLSYMERAPERFILGYAPDPRKPDAIGRMEAAVDIYGVRVYGELKLRMMYDNPDALRMFRFCGTRKIPVLVHIDYEIPAASPFPWPNYWYGGGIEAFERTLKACPETTFIGHAPGFWSHISGDQKFAECYYPQGPVIPGGKLITLLRDCPNLCCDISAGSGCNALSRDPEFSKGFLTEFQDRVMYGRDCFDNRHQECLATLGLSPVILDKIYSGNAIRLLAS